MTSTTIIDSSFSRLQFSVESSKLGELLFSVSSSEVGKKYTQNEVTNLEVIDSETYRSGSRAAAGAIVGGVLTGGLGFLAGAAFGGRRKKIASFVIMFADGNHVAFEESSTKLVDKLQYLSRSLHAKSVANSMKRD